MKTVKRKYGKSQAPIVCSIPPTLADHKIAISQTFELNNFNQPQYGEFKLNQFLNRYVAGEKSIKESRSVSRRRLALVNSGIGHLDSEAINLSTQIESYQQAFDFVDKLTSIDLKSLLKANAMLERHNKNAGKLRKIQNWIGGKSPLKAQYVCPPVEFLEELMNDWVNFVNNENYNLDIRGIIGHNQLLNIHPFVDGNGRASRVFLHVMLQKQYGELIHPCLYRLHEQQDGYINAIESTREPEYLTTQTHPFWQNSLSWCETTKQAMYEILAQGNKRIYNFLALKVIPEDSKRLLNYIWRQPIICFAGLQKTHHWHYLQAQQAIEPLVKAGLLEARRLKQPMNAIIYDCPLMFDIWQQLDDAIFSDSSAN